VFELVSPYSATPAQQQAVKQIVEAFQGGRERQVLLGVTGSGKTFTMARVIQDLGLATLVLAPNKTLAAQLYQEFRGFFPRNRVGYFISYYDYYQPEAFVPQRNLYIAKEVSINPDLERLRMEAVRGLLESRFTVVVASVSAIYNIGSPDDFYRQRLSFHRKSPLSREGLIHDLVNLGYQRSEGMINAGGLRVRGPAVEVFPTSEEYPLRFVISGDGLTVIEFFDPITGETREELDRVDIFPVSYFHYHGERVQTTVAQVLAELEAREAWFREHGRADLAERLAERTRFDMEQLAQFGHCPGIENYSLYLSGRRSGDPPFTLLDYFPRPFLTIMDESHITIPQLRGMYAGDRSRKLKLVEFGFRLPSALDNRPLRIEEAEARLDRVLYVSATPAREEIHAAGKNGVIELLVRPTGLLDPRVEERRVENPVHDLVAEIRTEVDKGYRVLVTTLTKRMAEKLTAFLAEQGIRGTYMHSEIKPLDRIRILQQLRGGEVDVLVGINLLREGLDLPEVSLVAVLDADREGFLRSERSLIQTFGRAARNVDGRVLLYMNDSTDSIRSAIRETHRRREYQEEYNRRHGLVPRSIRKAVRNFHDDSWWVEKTAIESDSEIRDGESLDQTIQELEKEMRRRADALDFVNAARLRDRVRRLKNLRLELF
jgi:excinuclease ABC subunit B